MAIVSGLGITLPGAMVSASAAKRTFILDQCAALGAKWVRVDVDNLVGNANVDATVDGVISRGMEAYCVIGGGHSPGDYANAAAYGTQCTNSVNHYAARGARHFELFNEPNNGPRFTPAQYAAYAIAGASAIRAISPTLYSIYICALGATDIPAALIWVNTIFGAGVAGIYDAFSVHAYFDPQEAVSLTWPMWNLAFGTGATTGAYPDNGPNGGNIRHIMNTHGDSAKPIINSEGGGQYPTFGAYTQAQIATDMPPYGTGGGFGRATGPAANNWYTILDDDVAGFGLFFPVNTGNTGQGGSVVAGEGTYYRRPAWDALKAAAAPSVAPLDQRDSKNTLVEIFVGAL